MLILHDYDCENNEMPAMVTTLQDNNIPFMLKSLDQENVDEYQVSILFSFVFYETNETNNGKKKNDRSLFPDSTLMLKIHLSSEIEKKACHVFQHK